MSLLSFVRRQKVALLAVRRVGLMCKGKAKCATCELPQSELSQNQASVEALIAMRNRRMQKKGEAEEATRLRNESMKALHLWMKEFRSIARIALQDSPQLLEALGIIVKSQKV